MRAPASHQILERQNRQSAEAEMSWWKENDVGSLSPRRGPPVGYNTQAVSQSIPVFTVMTPALATHVRREQSG